MQMIQIKNKVKQMKVLKMAEQNWGMTLRHNELGDMLNM